MAEISNAFVVLMGMGTVFSGLILIILFCKIVGLFCKVKPGKQNESENTADAPAVKTENRQEIIAAVTAACAEDMGKDVSALRVISFMKL